MLYSVSAGTLPQAPFGELSAHLDSITGFKVLLLGKDGKEKRYVKGRGVEKRGWR